MSDGGTAAFVHGSSETRQLLWWVDRAGQRVRQVGSPLSSYHLDLSPDGRLAVEIQSPVNSDIFLIDTATGRRDRLTFGQGFDQTPVWSPDGQRVAYVTFGTEGNSAGGIQVQQVEGGDKAVAIYTSEAATDLWVWSWSPDGWLAFNEREGGNGNIYALDADDGETRIDVAVTPYSEWFPQFSPDGRWLAYESDETGRREVYVISFPELGGKKQVSTQGGATPRWSVAGDELFFWQGTTLVVTTVSPGETFNSTFPQRLFEEADMVQTEGYDVSPDGQQFLLMVRNPDALVREIHVVENWFSELERLVPTN